MKFRFNGTRTAVFSALLASGTFQVAGVASAAVIASTAEARSEVRSLILDTSAAIESSPDSAEVVVAQNSAEHNKSVVTVITSGQEIDLPDLPDVNVIVSNAVAEAFSGGSTMHMAKNVKNAPYSAEVISENVQTLPDGNQITRKSSTMSFRDSAGRTRQETRDSKGAIRSIQIHDVVDGTRYVISPSRKSATKIGIDKDLQKRIEEIREKARAMARDGTAHIIEHSRPGEEIIVKRVELPEAEGKKGIRDEVRVNVKRMSGDIKLSVNDSGNAHYSFSNRDERRMALSELPQLSALDNLFMDGKWSRKTTTSQLGTKDFDGVRAEGKSVSYTIPAGEIGNKNPIVVSTETWTSPDLQVVVYSKHSDPRSGDSIYRLANVKRTEQPATLFMVPEGYAVKITPGLAIGAKQK